MVEIKWLIWLLFIPLGMNSQNLMKNGSFELADYLPCEQQFSLTFYANDWHTPHGGTTDYYNKKCEGKKYHHAVADFDRKENFTTGDNGIVGLYLFAWDGYMEHLTGNLKDSLVEGERYEVSFYFKHAGIHSRFFINAVGCMFSASEHPFGFHHPKMELSSFYGDLFEQTRVFTMVKIDSLDHNEWNKVSFIHVANGGEKYLTLGYFSNNYEELQEKIETFKKVNHHPKKRERFYKKNNYVFRDNIRYVKTKKIAEVGAYYFIDKVEVQLDGSVPK